MTDKLYVTGPRFSLLGQECVETLHNTTQLSIKKRQLKIVNNLSSLANYVEKQLRSCFGCCFSLVVDRRTNGTSREYTA